MKSIQLVVASVFCFFVLGVVNAQDFPEVTADNENWILAIPYLEAENLQGETEAYSLELVAPMTGELVFHIDEDTLLEDDERIELVEFTPGS